MKTITIYTTDYCSYCRAAKSFFQSKGWPFEEIDLSGQDDARADLTARTGQRTVPQIFVGDTHVGGYTDMRALDARGGMLPLLLAS